MKYKSKFPPDPISYIQTLDFIFSAQNSRERGQMCQSESHFNNFQ